MIWVVSLIIALIAYFIIQGLHARHISRCHTDHRTAEHVPDSIRVADAQADFHEQSAVTAAQVRSQRVPDDQSTPSLLYADRARSSHHQIRQHNQYSAEGQQHNQQQSDATTQESSRSGNTQCTVDDVIDMELATPNAIADPSLESTAEHAPINDVGIPTNNSEYAAANARQDESNNGLAAAGIAVATTAGVAAATSNQRRASNTDFEDEYSTQHGTIENSPTNNSTTIGLGTSENIDLELGETDNTYNDDEDIDGNNHDELLDFGDLTSDISDMLKELNLRETDSPRLEISKAEYEQLKTGEPGEVKPEKIENVADKLRNMLQ